MATFKYYLLPADQCANAIHIHNSYKKVAILKRDKLLTKYKAHGITYKGNVVSLYWTTPPDYVIQGFTDTKWNHEEKFWIQTPKKNTLIGKRAHSEIFKVCELNLNLESSLEKALGIYGYIFGWYQGQKCFLSTQAIPLDDGRVIIRFPVYEPDIDFFDRNQMDEPVLPSFAVEISIDEADELVGDPLE